MNIPNYSQLYSRDAARLLMQTGVSPHLHGFSMTCVAIELTIKYGPNYRKVVADLYPEISAIFGTTPASVERNIRTAINRAWSIGALKHFYEGLGLYAEKRPSNSAFIAQLAQMLQSGMADTGRIKATWR